MPEHETPTEVLYEEAPCALLSTRPGGEIVRANQTFCDWLGVPCGEIFEQVRFQSLLTMGSRIYYETHYAPLLRMQGFVSEIALEIRRRDGSVRPVVATAKVERDASGVPIWYHVALFDSSDRRRYEKELLEARKHAEAVSRELEAAEQRRSEFIAMLAHELRNPLAPIRTAVELQRRLDVAGNVVNRTTEMMQRQVGQMVRLVEDLLDVTRIAQDKLTLRMVPVDLSSVVHHALEANEPGLQQARLTLETQLPATAIYAEVDTARIVQVLSNVINNATKFTPPGGHVTLALESRGDEAVIRIRDTGIGIEATELLRVFDMFMQSNRPSDRRGGLGVGLTLARSLVERHGGRITVSSEGLGRGSEFTIHLPLLQTPPAAVISSSTALHVAPVSRRVLVVDDNRDSTEMMGLSLELEGHEVRKAYDGIEALEIAEAFRPDVLLLDIGLPKLDGYRVAERIRARSGDQPVLVALTGWGQESDRQRSEDAGFDAHLVKPVDHDELTRVIATRTDTGTST